MDKRIKDFYSVEKEETFQNKKSFNIKTNMHSICRTHKKFKGYGCESHLNWWLNFNWLFISKGIESLPQILIF